MDSILTLLIIVLLIGNFIAVILLLKRKQPDQIDNSQILKDEVSSLKNSFSQSFGSMSKEIAKDMTGLFHLLSLKRLSYLLRFLCSLNRKTD